MSVMSGRVDISKLKVPPEKHELETARYFAERGHDVEFIPPNYSPKMHTPDVIMDGVAWEIKCPTGKSKRTIENNFRAAVAQSHNIVFDLRRIQVSESQCLSQLESKFQSRTYVRRLLIIKKDGELVEMKRS